MALETTLISEPMHIFAALCCVIALIHGATGLKALSGLFNVVPPVVWMYFFPLILTSIGIIPSTSPLYNWMSAYLLPFALLLITISISLKDLRKIGRIALILFLTGTTGILVGSVVVFAVMKDFLPPDGWQSMSMLSATWIGGSANMLAVHQSLQADPALFGPIVIVDTVVGYGWLGILIAVCSYQRLFDKKLRANRDMLDTLIVHHDKKSETKRPIKVKDIMIMVGGAFTISILCRALADYMPSVGDPTIISTSTWVIIMVVAIGVLLSFTKLQKLDNVGASDFGYAALFLLLSSVGAQADLRAILEAPLLLFAGILVMLFHIALLLIAAYVLRAPFLLVVTGSMANVGGAVSAPIAATAYSPAFAPIGAFLGVLGYICGVYLPILLSGIMAMVAGV